jgi:ribosomal protein L11 methyltransferase
MPKLSKIKKMTENPNSIAQELLKIVNTSCSRLTPSDLATTLYQKFRLEKKQIRGLIKKLMAKGELTYNYEHGCTFIEPSFNRPVRVSKYVVLKPPGCHFQAQSDDVVIQIKNGASFGDGRHPTTRLAIRCIEYVLKEFKLDHSEHKSTVLDIGTGTGILVLTAACLGIDKGLGIDIDPCARSEAKENILMNGLENRIEISDQYLETIDQSFCLVTANLRFPTLKSICACVRKIVSVNGFIAFSGIRSHELADLIKTYSRRNFETLWREKELDWVGVVLRKL